MASRLVTRNIVVNHARTSMRLEPELWEMLGEVCEREGQELTDVMRTIAESGDIGGRTSAVRIYVASYFRAAATEAGHANAGHPQLIEGSLVIPKPRTRRRRNQPPVAVALAA
jgi:predicted DNA-binding ribbon-helix-helix protein